MVYSLSIPLDLCLDPVGRVHQGRKSLRVLLVRSPGVNASRWDQQSILRSQGENSLAFNLEISGLMM